MSMVDNHVTDGHGYSELFVAADDIDDNCFCPICRRVLRNPVQTSPCGHRFCKYCFQRANEVLQNPANKCPLDNEPVTSVFPDNAFQRVVMSLETACRAKELGCGHVCQLRHLENHLDECTVYPIPCGQGKCPLSFNRLQIEAHRAMCRHKENPCQYCGEMVSVKDITFHMVSSCSMFPMKCPKCDKFSGPRSKVMEHMCEVYGTCQETATLCPFHTIGCNAMFIRKTMDDHMNKEALHHNILMTKTNVSILNRLDELERKLNCRQTDANVAEFERGEENATTTTTLVRTYLPGTMEQSFTEPSVGCHVQQHHEIYVPCRQAQQTRNNRSRRYTFHHRHNHLRQAGSTRSRHNFSWNHRGRGTATEVGARNDGGLDSATPNE